MPISRLPCTSVLDLHMSQFLQHVNTEGGNGKAPRPKFFLILCLLSPNTFLSRCTIPTAVVVLGYVRYFFRCVLPSARGLHTTGPSTATRCGPDEVQSVPSELFDEFASLS